MNPQPPVSYNSAPGPSRNWVVTGILAVVLIAALGFGGWAYSKMSHYKNDADQIAAQKVDAAKKTQAAQLQAQFDEQSKSPFKVFQGSPTYGSISFNYPKTWSAYVDTTNQSEPINAYFFPGEVPGVQSKTAFALRLELVSTDYSQIVQQLSSQIKQGNVTAQAYVPPKLNGVANVQPGTLFSGQINIEDQTQRGTLLAIKVRDKTLEIYTESSDYSNDYTNTVLASLSFAP